MKTLKTLLLFLSGALLLTTCGPDDKEPIEPEKEQKQPKPRVKDSDFENRTWQFMGYGNTDSVQLDLPEDAALYSLILSDSLLTATIPAVSCIAKYTLTTDKKISIDSLTGSGVNESLYINALKNLVQAHTYEVSNEVLKIFFSEKQYLLFVEENEQYPKESSFIYFYTYPFNLKADEKLIINNRAELFKRCIESTPYFPYTWAIINGCSGFDLDGIDFSKSSLLLGCIGTEIDLRGYKQEFWQIGKNTYHYKVYSHFSYPQSYNKLYYGMVVDKIADKASIIYDLKIKDYSY